jgi:hypothetical protein
VLDPSPDRVGLSWSCSVLQSLFRDRLASIWVGRSPHALYPVRVGSRVFVGRDRQQDPMDRRRRSSHGLVLSFRVLRASSRRGSFATLPGPIGRHGSSHEVLLPFSVFPHAAAAWWPGLPRPTACVLRFSQPRDALIRPVPVGLVSCRIRSWGCALQSFLPLAEPCAISGACAPLDVG